MKVTLPTNFLGIPKYKVFIKKRLPKKNRFKKALADAKKYGIAAGLRRFLRSDGKLKQACVARYELAKSRYETAQQATWDKIKLSRQAIFDLKARHEDLVVKAEEVTTMIEQEQENLRSLQKQLKKEEKLIERNEDFICVLSGIKTQAESTDEERGLFGFVNKDLKEIREKVGIEKMEHIDLIPIAHLRDIVTCLIIEGMNDHAHCVDHEITLASGHGDKTKEEVAKEVAMALGLYSVEEEEVDELETALGLAHDAPDTEEDEPPRKKARTTTDTVEEKDDVASDEHVAGEEAVGSDEPVAGVDASEEMAQG